jgi:hypothetical protein
MQAQRAGAPEGAGGGTTLRELAQDLWDDWSARGSALTACCE